VARRGLFVRPLILTLLVLVVLFSRSPRRRRDAKEMLKLVARQDAKRGDRVGGELSHGQCN